MDMKEKQTLVELKTIVNLQIPEYDKLLSNHPNQDKIKFRRDRINRLRISGYTNMKIAEKIGCSLSTVEKDLQIIREHSKKWYADESIKDYCQSIQDFIIFYDNAIEDLQILFNESADVKEKIEILDKIVEFKERKLELYLKTKSVGDFLERC
jgi:IS30 family transposase